MTPYMHVTAYHVGHFLKKYGNIKQFSGQGKLQYSTIQYNTVQYSTVQYTYKKYLKKQRCLK